MSPKFHAIHYTLYDAIPLSAIKRSCILIIMRPIVIPHFIALVTFGFIIFQYLYQRYRKKILHRLMDHGNIGYYRCRDRDNTILYANDGFCKMLDLDMSREDVIGRSLRELLIDVEERQGILDKIKTQKEIINQQWHFKTLKGESKFVMYNACVARDEYIRENVIEVLMEDITEVRLSCEKMRSSQERYKKLFEDSGDMVVIYRFDNGVIEEVNPITEDILGFTSEELVGRSFENLFHPTNRKYLWECRDDLLFKGTARQESVVVRKDGSYREVILTLTVVVLENETLITAIIKDVSEMVKDRQETEIRKKELEDFWKASVEREERIKELRVELEKARQQIKFIKEKR